MKSRSKGARQNGDTYAIGVDIGGTFTDLVAFGSKSGRIAVAKVLTDYGDLARGVVAGIRQILSESEIEPASVTRVVHGTTLVTNSLLERRGATTAMIVTRGFGDVLEMGRESRYDIYEIDIDLPAPIVPRDLVFEVTERLDFRGEVVTPLDESELDSIMEELRERGVQSVAVCLLHSYTNNRHEKRIAEVLARMPGISVSLSSDVMPDLREYERASTTAANAYVRPVVIGYLDTLRHALRGLGVPGQLSIMTSDGGVIDVDTAARFPVRLTESGPAGGATAASYLGSASGVPDLIAYDMGGTTAKICVIESGKPLKASSFEFGRVYRFAKGSGLPLQIPVVEMIEIGAGGGSIAQVNALGMLQIGPESANAAPGPACYGLGGTGATVSDADLVLGYIASESFLGGAMRLDIEAARSARNWTASAGWPASSRRTPARPRTCASSKPATVRTSRTWWSGKRRSDSRSRCTACRAGPRWAGRTRPTAGSAGTALLAVGFRIPQKNIILTIGKLEDKVALLPAGQGPKRLVHQNRPDAGFL